MRKTKFIHIGTSGWDYQHWLGPFYPDNYTEKEFLKHYARHFSTVEVNNTFYHLPKDSTIVAWTEAVPENFIFAVKASRYITHMKKLIDPEQSTTLFFERIQRFKNKLGPILFQLPPRFAFNPDRLEAFLKVLPVDYKYTFEFRDPSWFNSVTYNLLSKHNAAFCIYYLGNYHSPKETTADFVYIRYHGPIKLGSGLYNYENLIEFSDEIKSFFSQGKEIFCYFNNDEAGYAVRNAVELQQMLGNMIYI